MTEWTSISVTEEQKATLEAAQEQAGHDGAIGRFLVREVAGDGREGLTTTLELDADAVVDELKDELSMSASPLEVKSLVEKIEELEAAVKEATQAAQSTEQTVEELR